MLRFLLLIVLVLQSIFTYSQNWNLIYTKELEAEDYLYDKQYDKAIKKYGEALKMAPTSANLKFKIGMCYLSTADKRHLALDFFKEAAENASIDFDPRAIKELRSPIEAHYYLGVVYQINEQFQEAIASFNRFRSFLESDDPRIKEVENRIQTCRIAPSLIAERIGVSSENLGNKINDEDQNFNAVISGDGSTMAYTTQKGGRYDIYVSRKKDGEWQKARRITDDIRGGFLKTSSLSYDGTWLYLVDDFSPKKQIYDTFYDEIWVRSKKLKKPITSKKFNETHAAVSPDGKTLYFASDRDEGHGGLDIYKATLDDKERWGNVVNLGPRVNTEFDEDTPFVTPDGMYLFFSSQGHSSIGGYDIFYIDLEGSGEPVNLGYPINNPDDNLFYYPLSLTSGLMALSNPDALGPQDIYEMTIIPLVNINGNIAVVGEEPQDASSVKISIFDAESIEPVAEISKSVAEKTFSKKLLPGEYRVEAKADGFEDFETVLAVASDATNQSLDVNLISLFKEPEEEPALALIEDVVEELAEEVKEEVKEEVEEEIVEKPVEPEPAPQPQPEPQPEPKPQPQPVAVDNIQPSEGLFTVQIMALIVPVPESHFKNIEGLTITKGSDGYNRYTVGVVSTRSEAAEIQQKLRALGYKDSFVKRFTLSTASSAEAAKPQTDDLFGIQVLALKKPLGSNQYKGTDVTVVQGDDGFYRYFAGQYSTYQQACNDLNRVINLGHKNAFIKRL
ncbi:MAG: hypothetical protein PHI03_07680 [Bacteroidales bacterium]|nr:hypothetical protein [Bacteroidales bacterium]